MPHTHLNHQNHHHVEHPHHAGHHEVKRGMENKTFLWIIGVVLVVAIVVAAFVFIPKGETAPDPVAEQCASFCETNQKDAFCSFNVNADDNLRTTCQQLATNSAYSKYNVQPCSTISCQQTAEELDKTCVTGLKSVWATPLTDGACPIQEGKTARKRTSSDSPPIEGQICCFYY